MVKPKRRKFLIKKAERRRKAAIPRQQIIKKLSSQNAEIKRLASWLNSKFNEIIYERGTPPTSIEVAEINRKIKRTETLLKKVQMETLGIEYRLGEKEAKRIRHETEKDISSFIDIHSKLMTRFKNSGINWLHQ